MIKVLSQVQSVEGYMQHGYLHELEMLCLNTAGADSTAVFGLFKDVFEEGIAEGVNNSNPLSDIFKRETTDYKGGKGPTFVAHVGRNPSPMFVAEDGAFATAGAQRHIQGSVDIRKMMARLRLTQEAMDDSVNSVASWKSAKKDEMTRIVDDIAKREEFALSCDGKGILCALTAATPTNDGTALTVKNPGNIANASFGNRFVQPGMYLAAISPADGSIRTGIVKVVSVDSAGAIINIDAAVNAAWLQNDYVVQAANSTVTDTLDTSYEKAYWGLPALVDDGTNRATYFGVNRSQAPSYKSYVVASSGALATDVMQRTADVVYQTLGGEINLLLMHPSVRREYIKLTEADRRYSSAAGDAKQSDPGTVAFKQGDLTLGEVTVKAIRTLGLDQVYFLDTTRMGAKQYVAEAGRFVDDDGSVLVRDGVGDNARHAFEAWWFARKQNFISNPAVCARFDGVTGQTLVVVPEL
jgi:hypothetical protein